jgi:hypothetical protein
MNQFLLSHNLDGHNLIALRALGAAMKLNLSVQHKTQAEAFHVLEMFTEDLAEKHITLTYLYVLKSHDEVQTLINMFEAEYTVRGPVLIATASLCHWVRIIKYYAHANQDEWILNHLNQMQISIERLALAQLFQDKIKEYIPEGFYLR